MDVSGWIIIAIIIIVILMKSKFKEHGEFVSDFTQILLKVAATFEYELGLLCFQKAE